MTPRLETARARATEEARALRNSFRYTEGNHKSRKHGLWFVLALWGLVGCALLVANAVWRYEPTGQALAFWLVLHTAAVYMLGSIKENERVRGR